MILVLALLGGIQPADARPAKQPDDLELYRRAVSESFYAGDKYQCQGMRPLPARRAADRALGGNFGPRLRRAAAVLNTRYDPSVVEAAGELIAIGYKITPARCREVRTIVTDALYDMAELDRRLRIN